MAKAMFLEYITPVYDEMQRAFPGSGVLILHYMNSFGSGLNATDVQLQVKDPP